MKRNALLFGYVVLGMVGSVCVAQGQRALMGVELDSAPLPELLTKHLGLEAGQGVRIRNIIVDSPADKAGLVRDDLIVDFQGKKVVGVEQIIEGVRAANVGDEVTLEVIHLGQRKTLRLKLQAAQENRQLKYPAEPEAMTTWRPGKIFKIGPDGQDWMEVPFDKIPDFNVDVNRFFKERRVFRYRADNEDFTIIIEGDPKDENATVIVQAGGEEYRTTADKLDALPKKYRDRAREAVENARKDVKNDVVLGKRFRLPEPPRPEVYQKYFRSIPGPDMERLSERMDRAVERIQTQVERLQERIQALEERNRQMLEQFLDRKNTPNEKGPVPEKPETVPPSAGDPI